MYIGTDKEAPGVNITGMLYGDANQLLLQIEGAAFIIVYNVDRDLHHPEGDRPDRAAADGRGDAEGRRRRSARRDRLRDRNGGRIARQVRQSHQERLRCTAPELFFLATNPSSCLNQTRIFQMRRFMTVL